MISVYSRTANADTELLHILEKYLIDLGDYYTDDEIDILLSEYSALAMYCHQHDDIFYSSSGNRRKSMIAGFQSGVSDFLAPIDLVNMCLKIADCKTDSNIYLPLPVLVPLPYISQLHAIMMQMRLVQKFGHILKFCSCRKVL